MSRFYISLKESENIFSECFSVDNSIFSLSCTLYSVAHHSEMEFEMVAFLMVGLAVAAVAAVVVRQEEPEICLLYTSPSPRDS